MSVLKILRCIRYKSCVIHHYPKYLSNSTGGKGKDKGSNTSNNDSTDSSSDNPCGTDDNPSAPTMYDCRKYGHNLPCNSVMPNFELLPYIPSGIFRCTYGEMLGRGANKCSCYQNPEYFSYHHMTFYDMHLILRPCRKPSPNTGRKP